MRSCEQRFDEVAHVPGRVHRRRRALSDQGDDARRRGRLGVGARDGRPRGRGLRARARLPPAAGALLRRRGDAAGPGLRSRPRLQARRVWRASIDQQPRRGEARAPRASRSSSCPGQPGLQLDRKAAEAGSSARSPGSSAAAPSRSPSRSTRSRSTPPISRRRPARPGSRSRRPSGSSTPARAGSCRAGASPSSSPCRPTARPSWRSPAREPRRGSRSCARPSSTPRSTRPSRSAPAARSRSSRTSPASASTCPRPRRRSSPPPSRRRARTAELVVRTTVAERTAAEAQAMGITGVVGSYHTTYGGIPSRLHNVALVAQLIDGALIAPGETFSFNGTTGERTAEKGFQEAPVIINGELQTGLGGGICQVSTTVFNAAYEAGLADRRADQPRALHLALPARPRRDGQLPRSRPQVHERHRQLAAPAHVRRLGLADGQPLRDAAEPAGRDRRSSRSASSAHRR